MRKNMTFVGLYLGVVMLFLIFSQQFPHRTGAESAPENDVYLPIVKKPPLVPPPWIEETAVTIESYQYDHPDCLRPTELGDFVFPYPRINHDCVFQKPNIVRTFQAIILHNHYVSITVLPELGGRLYRWQDKMTGRQLLYNNPVLKPTGWGWRGWWLATGGIEWCFPADEHGLNEYRPWSYSTETGADFIAITISDVENQTEMEVGVTLSLDADHTYVTILPWVRNETLESHNYQYWFNAMVALDNNHVSNQTEFIVPTSEIVIHSEGDPDLPGEHSVISWPEYNGRNLSWYDTWNGWIGFFAPNITDGFSGIYDHGIDQGIVRTFDPALVPGHKFFGPDTLGSGLWTDDDSDYVEMWSSGVTSDFWTYASLAAGETITWTEKWYPVSGIGGFHKANEYAALRLTDTGNGADIGVEVTAVTSGTITLWADGILAETWPVALAPGQPFREIWERPSGTVGPLGLRLEDEQENTLIEVGILP